MAVKEKHSHYYKNVAHLKDIDAYRVLERFGVTDPSIQHAVKKLLVAGGRGAGKDQDQDVQESIDSLLRFQEMRIEDSIEAVNFKGVQVVVDASFPDVDDPAVQEAFKRALQGIARPEAPGKRAKKMPEAVKRDLGRRKAAKRATKAAPRRGR